MFSRWLAFTLSFAIAFAPIASPAMSTRWLCKAVVQAPKIDILKDELEARQEIEEKTVQFNKDLQEHWTSQQTEIVATAKLTGLFFSALTRYLIKKNKHTLPFTDLKSGIPQRILLWVKDGPNGQAKTQDDVQAWIAQYKAFQTERQTLIERMAVAQTQQEILDEALKLGKFPIDLHYPRAFEGGVIQFESRHYLSGDLVAQDLRMLKNAEGGNLHTALARHFANRRFLEARDREQAALRRRLEMVQDNLIKFPDALKNPEERAKDLSEIKELLAREDLNPPLYADHIETRHMFYEELYAYSVGQKYDNDGVAANKDLIARGENSLGVDQDKLGFMRRSIRLVGVSIPAQLITVFMAWAVPAGTHVFNVYVQPPSYVQSITHENDATYLEKARAFLKERYAIDIDSHNHIVTSTGGQNAIARLRQEHENYKKLQAQQAAEDAMLNQLLSHPHKLLSPDAFTSIIKADPTQVKQLIATNKLPPGEAGLMQKYRDQYRLRLKQNENSVAILSDLYGDFSVEPD